MDRAVGLVLLVFSILYMRASWSLPRFQMTTVVDSWVFPLAVGMALFLLSAVLFLRPQDVQPEIPDQVRRPVSILIALLLYALVLDWLGFVVSTALFFLGTSVILGWRRWVVGMGVSVAFSVLVYITFTRVLAVPLPQGILPW